MHTTVEENSTKEKIHLTLLNGTGYVFDVTDYMRLRKEHHIVGALVGTSCTRGWSVNECTLPVELTPCETRLLIEENIALLVSKQSSLLRVPTDSEQQTNKAEFEERITAQAEALKAEKLREAERNLDKIMAGKKKKLLRAGTPEADIQLQPADLLKEIAANVTFERKNALLEIPCAHPQPHTAHLAEPPIVDELKYKAFRDFWLRGKFITAGDAFGADFLIYPGDPMLYHASHIVILLDTPQIQPLELITKVRLSVIVNKLCVFAYFDNDEENEPRKVRYQTVKWEGNRDREKLDE